MPTCSRETVAWVTHHQPKCSYSSDSGSSRPSSPDINNYQQESEPWLHWYPAIVFTIAGQILWYPALVVDIGRQMLFHIFSKILTFTLGLLFKFPLSVFKWMLSTRRARGRTVLITGSSVQTLQLARNYHQSGARVVLVQHQHHRPLGLSTALDTVAQDKYSDSSTEKNSLEHVPSLLNFSTAVDKVYEVPTPQTNPQAYIREICRVAEHEKASYFISSASSSPAHYEALTKPHLEQLGVSCVCPGIKETLLLDDPLSLLQICHNAGLLTPVNYRVSSLQHLTVLYDQGHLRRARHVLMSAGPLAATQDPAELELPLTRRGFRRLLHTYELELSASRPGLVIQVPEGERLVTCSTVRDNKLVANVTCKSPYPGETPSLEPLQREDVDALVSKLLNSLPRSFNGHLSLTMICTRHGLVPLKCKLGVSLPYLCYSEHQARIFLRPCKHHPQPPVCVTRPKYWIHQSMGRVLSTPSVSSAVKLLGTVITRQEALFTLWDPIPACLYYGLYVPAKLVRAMLVSRSKKQISLSQHVHFSELLSCSTYCLSDLRRETVQCSDVSKKRESFKRRSDSNVNKDVTFGDSNDKQVHFNAQLSEFNARLDVSSRHVHFSETVNEISETLNNNEVDKSSLELSCSNNAIITSPSPI